MSDTTITIVLGGISLVGMSLVGWYNSSAEFYNPFKGKGSIISTKDFFYVAAFFMFVLVPVLIAIIYDFSPPTNKVTEENVVVSLKDCPLNNTINKISDHPGTDPVRGVDGYDGAAAALLIAHSTVRPGNFCPQCVEGWGGPNCICLAHGDSAFLGSVGNTFKVDNLTKVGNTKITNLIHGTGDNTCETYCKSVDQCNFFIAEKIDTDNYNINCTLYSNDYILTERSTDIVTTDGCAVFRQGLPKLLFKAKFDLHPNLLIKNVAYIITGESIPDRYWLADNNSISYTNSSFNNVIGISTDTSYEKRKVLSDIPKGTPISCINVTGETLRFIDESGVSGLGNFNSVDPGPDIILSDPITVQNSGMSYGFYFVGGLVPP